MTITSQADTPLGLWVGSLLYCATRALEGFKVLGWVESGSVGGGEVDTIVLLPWRERIIQSKLMEVSSFHRSLHIIQFASFSSHHSIRISLFSSFNLHLSLLNIQFASLSSHHSICISLFSSFNLHLSLLVIQFASVSSHHSICISLLSSFNLHLSLVIIQFASLSSQDSICISLTFQDILMRLWTRQTVFRLALLLSQRTHVILTARVIHEVYII